ncbi:WapI family immunity protein [Planococcus sp. FY231025]|uniref:WapI family immunity protein n=1 Tax=Planococcus sp. FY231025 TaxID=3455699 RepID=UPI003F920F09
MAKLYILGTDTKIEIEVLKRCFPEAIGSWEGDWVKTAIRVQIPGFSADFHADLRTDEFREFRNQLVSMNKNLEGTATLISIENVIQANAMMNPQGGIFWNVTIRYPVSSGAVLDFEFGSDQSYLDQLIKELEEVLVEFPVLERQDDIKSRLNSIYRKIRGSEK